MTQCGSRDFLFTMVIAYKSFLFGELKFDRYRDSPLLVFLCITRKPKNLHLSLRLLRLKSASKHTAIVANVNKILRNYFRVTTALCHLTAVYGIRYTLCKCCGRVRHWCLCRRFSHKPAVGCRYFPLGPLQPKRVPF